MPRVSILLRHTTGKPTQRALYSSCRQAPLKLQPFILPLYWGSSTIALTVEPSDAFDILENERLPEFKASPTSSVRLEYPLLVKQHMTCSNWDNSIHAVAARRALRVA